MSLLPLEKLSLDLSRVQHNSEATDIAFEANGTTYRAHTDILRERCPRLLSLGIAKKPRNCWCRHKRPQLVELPVDVAELLPDFLEYAYTGKIERIQEVADSLIKLTHNWEINELKDQCEQALCESLDRNNCVSRLILGHDYNCLELTQKAKNVILKCIDEIIDRDDFMLLYKRLDLLKIIIREISMKKDENGTVREFRDTGRMVIGKIKKFETESTFLENINI